MNRVTIGIDNGCTGTIGIFAADGMLFETVPHKEHLQGRAGKVIKRIDHAALDHLLRPLAFGQTPVHAFVERPFTGKFLNAVLPGQRAFEAVLVVLEQLAIGYDVVDSKDWQKPVLGAVKGSANLKRASWLRGAQLYPQFAEQIKAHGDADGLLIAHHFHHNH